MCARICLTKNKGRRCPTTYSQDLLQSSAAYAHHPLSKGERHMMDSTWNSAKKTFAGVGFFPLYCAVFCILAWRVSLSLSLYLSPLLFLSLSLFLLRAGEAQWWAHVHPQHRPTLIMFWSFEVSDRLFGWRSNFCLQYQLGHYLGLGFFLRESRTCLFVCVGFVSLWSPVPTSDVSSKKTSWVSANVSSG